MCSVRDWFVVTDDHHPPPTFTPPELPKKVHVRGITLFDPKVNCLVPLLFLIHKRSSCIVYFYLFAL